LLLLLLQWQMQRSVAHGSDGRVMVLYLCVSGLLSVQVVVVCRCLAVHHPVEGNSGLAARATASGAVDLELFAGLTRPSTDKRQVVAARSGISAQAGRQTLECRGIWLRLQLLRHRLLQKGPSVLLAACTGPVHKQQARSSDQSSEKVGRRIV